jgi:putative sigma-54 modulation protein
MNNQKPPTSTADRLIVSGIHLELTEALRNTVVDKTARLFRHQEHIVRLRVDLEHDKSRDVQQRFIAKGYIEISGPDLVASVASEDAYKSLHLLVDKLDGLLRRRASHRKENQHHPRDVEIPADLPKLT